MQIIISFLIIFGVFTNNNKTYCEWKDIENTVERIKSISGDIQLSEIKKFSDDEYIKFKIDKFKYWLLFNLCYYNLHPDLKKENLLPLITILMTDNTDFTNIDIARKMINNGIEHKEQTKKNNTTNNMEETANALNNNSFEMIKLLIENGYEVNDFYYDTPMINLAVKSYYFNEKVIDYFLENGADINSYLNVENTPLLFMLDNKEFGEFGRLRTIKIDEVKYLVKQGADVKAKDYKGNDVLFYAKKTGNEEIIKYLEEELKKPNRIHQGIVLLKTYLLRVFYDKRRAEILKRGEVK